MSFLSNPYNEKKSRFDLQTLLDTSRLLIESHDVDFVLNNLLLISMGKLMINRAAILRYQPRKNGYIVAKKKGPLSLPDSFTVPRTLFENQTTLFCDRHDELQYLADLDISALIAIQNSERHFGFLALGRKVNHQKILDEELEILESLVYISGIAIANSELVGELRDTNRKLDYKVQELHTLFDLSKAFNASIDRDQIKRLFRYTLLGQLFIRRFFMIIRRKGKPVAVTQNGLGAELDNQQMNALFSLKKSIVTVDDTVRDQFPFLEEMKIHLILNLSNMDTEPAIIGLGKRANGKDFEPSDFNFLISLGNLVLISIQNSWLLEDQIEKERMEEELQIARSIQQRLFPDQPPNVPGLQIAAKNVPSYEVGGDYYDLIGDDDGNVTMAIADVTGKGVPASLLMANLQSVLHILQPFDIGLVKATGQINALIHQNTPSDKFISFFWGRFDSKKRSLSYVNAGHNPPILLRREGEPVRLSEGGVLLGAMPTLAPYTQEEVSLQNGDLLVMYTDGVTEAMNEKGEEFDEFRLIQSVAGRRDQNPEDILDGIISDVIRFCDDQISDDLTLIICKVAS